MANFYLITNEEGKVVGSQITPGTIDRPDYHQVNQEDYKAFSQLAPYESLWFQGAATYPDWESGTEYAVGDIVTHDGIMYEVIQAHTSQSDWLPPVTTSLYKVYTPGHILAEWVQPTGAHDAYGLGDRVIHHEEVWVSVVAANVWEPGVEGWEITGYFEFHADPRAVYALSADTLEVPVGAEVTITITQEEPEDETVLLEYERPDGSQGLWQVAFSGGEGTFVFAPQVSGKYRLSDGQDWKAEEPLVIAAYDVSG